MWNFAPELYFSSSTMWLMRPTLGSDNKYKSKSCLSMNTCCSTVLHSKLIWICNKHWLSADRDHLFWTLPYRRNSISTRSPFSHTFISKMLEEKFRSFRIANGWMDNKVPHNGFLPIAVPVCSAVQGGESSAAAGERLHFNYGAGCRCGAAGQRGRGRGSHY